MQTMASLGHKVFAIDLPGIFTIIELFLNYYFDFDLLRFEEFLANVISGFGETPSYSGDRGEFLDDVIKRLCGDVKPVLVSPSMAGSFSLPLIERDQG